MIRKLILALILLAVIAAAALYFFGSSALNKGVKSGVETFGPRVTQTAVTLDKVNISVFSGSGTLQGLNVGNPDGFKNKDIFALEQIDMKVDTSTVFSDKIIIDHIIIKRPAISYEKTLKSSNVKQLMKNIEAYTGSDDPADPEPAADTGAKKQVVIRKLLIEDGTIYVGAMGVGQTVPLPRIEMNDIGEDGSQITMAEAIDLVVGKVIKSIGPAIANAGQLSGAAVEALKTQGMEKVDQATDTLKKQSQETINQATEKVNESIQGLFNK